MDLMLMNDIYCKDTARIYHDSVYKAMDMGIECRFTPYEDEFFTYGYNSGMVHAFVCNPFDKVTCVELNHSVRSILDILGDVPVTSYFLNEQGTSTNTMERYAKYDEMCNVYLQEHPDYVMSGVIPGMCIISDLVRNQNFQLVNEYAISEEEKEIVNNRLKDARSLSMIYIKKDNSRVYGFGSLIYVGDSFTDLPYALCMYLFNNTFIMSRSPFEDEHHNARTMKTVCNILYEDSIEKILEMIDKERET